MGDSYLGSTHFHRILVVSCKTAIVDCLLQDVGTFKGNTSHVIDKLSDCDRCGTREWRALKKDRDEFVSKVRFEGSHIK